MAIKSTTYKTVGMQRDNSESAHSSQFAFENMNMRVTSRNNNTQLSLQNEQGNTPIEIIDIDTQSPIELKGIPIGYSTIDNIITLFTTETKYSNTDIYDEGQLINLQSQFKFNFFRFYDIDNTNIRFIVGIEETGSPKISDQLKISLTVSYIILEGNNYKVLPTKVLQGQRFSDPTEGVSYIFQDRDTDLMTLKYIVVNHISVLYKSKSLFECNSNTVIPLTDRGTLVTNITNTLFPLYEGDSLYIEESTGVTKSLNGYFLQAINGSVVSTGDNVYQVINNEGYTESYSYYEYKQGQLTYIGTSIPTQDPTTPEIPAVFGLVIFNKETQEDSVTTIKINPTYKILIDGAKTDITVTTVPILKNNKLEITSTSPEVCSVEYIINQGQLNKIGIKANLKGECYIQASIQEYPKLTQRCQIVVQEHTFSVTNPAGDNPTEFNYEGIPLVIGNNLISVNSNDHWKIIIPNSYSKWIKAKVVGEVPSSKYFGNKTVEIYLEELSSSVERIGYLELVPVNNKFASKVQRINIIQKPKN